MVPVILVFQRHLPPGRCVGSLCFHGGTTRPRPPSLAALWWRFRRQRDEFRPAGTHPWSLRSPLGRGDSGWSHVPCKLKGVGGWLGLVGVGWGRGGGWSLRLRSVFFWVDFEGLIVFLVATQDDGKVVALVGLKWWNLVDGKTFASWDMKPFPWKKVISFCKVT